MKIKKQVYITEDIDIEGITLLSSEEYERYRDNIPAVDFWWWLRSPGCMELFVSSVHLDGLYTVGDYVLNTDGSIRPVLHLKSDNLSIGEVFEFGNHKWTMIGKNVALCDTAFCKMAFRNDLYGKLNDYEYSAIRQYLEKWLEEQKN